MILVAEDAYSVVIYQDHEKRGVTPRPLQPETTHRYELAARYHAS
jgi:hypothetical protein